LNFDIGQIRSHREITTEKACGHPACRFRALTPEPFEHWPDAPAHSSSSLPLIDYEEPIQLPSL
jgi:hypothetical protein